MILIAAATMRFDGSQHLSLYYGGSRVSEAENLSFRFRTQEKTALVFATRDATSPDRLQITLGKLLKIAIGLVANTTLFLSCYICETENLYFPFRRWKNQSFGSHG